jgi:hypothetical protein
MRCPNLPPAASGRREFQQNHHGQVLCRIQKWQRADDEIVLQLLPHVGFETVEAISAKADIGLRHLEDFLRGRGQAS